jgi:hypothetical protein
MTSLASLARTRTAARRGLVTHSLRFPTEAVAKGEKRGASDPRPVSLVVDSRCRLRGFSPVRGKTGSGVDGVRPPYPILHPPNGRPRRRPPRPGSRGSASAPGSRWHRRTRRRPGPPAENDQFPNNTSRDPWTGRPPRVGSGPPAPVRGTWQARGPPSAGRPWVTPRRRAGNETAGGPAWGRPAVATASGWGGGGTGYAVTALCSRAGCRHPSWRRRPPRLSWRHAQPSLMSMARRPRGGGLVQGVAPNR